MQSLTLYDDKRKEISRNETLKGMPGSEVIMQVPTLNDKKRGLRCSLTLVLSLAIFASLAILSMSASGIFNKVSNSY